MQTLVVVHECTHTRLGVRELLVPLSPDVQVSGDEAMAVLSARLPGMSPIDLLVLSLHHVTPCAQGSLLRLLQTLRLFHPHCRVLLALDTTRIAHVCFLKRTFLLAGVQVGGIDLSMPVGALFLQLRAILSGGDLPPLPFDWASLSTREYDVLNALLAGKTPRQIGKTLHLSEKTVSHYKRHGLVRLGVRNFQGLLLAVSAGSRSGRGDRARRQSDPASPAGCVDELLPEGGCT